MKTTPSAPVPDPHPPEGAELHATATKLEIYETERLAFTDAATAPPAVPNRVTKRMNAWLEAIRCWVLSRS